MASEMSQIQHTLYFKNEGYEEFISHFSATWHFTVWWKTVAWDLSIASEEASMMAKVAWLTVLKELAILFIEYGSDGS